MFSISTEKSYFITNQYDKVIKMYGSGIYAHDSYFKALIFIGSDFTMLFFCVPWLLISLILDRKKTSIKTKIKLISTMTFVFYYAASIAFGVTYNALHLVYIALFIFSLFTVATLVNAIDLKILQEKQSLPLPTKGMQIFLILSGFSLFIAWLPDIITSLINHSSLDLIEVYTTDITYILDMGIISPLIFICLYLLKKKHKLGALLLLVLLRACGIIGIMLPFQTLFQTVLGNIEIPIATLITKVGIFILLSIFSFYFEAKLYRGLSNET